jgi:guanylate kinase
MQGGFFAAYNNPLTITKIEDILSWSELDYNGATGTIYAICGTKSVGKSEAIHHVMQYVPGTEMIPKYSTRKPRSDDAILSDTRALQGSSIETDFKDHINWQSYGNRCAISRREIDAVLEKGNDVFLAIGQVEGLVSVLSYYPDNTVYFVIERDPARIASALKERSKKEKRELDVPFESVVSVQNEFIDSFHFAKIENYSFFNVARTMENFIARRRSH